MGVLFRDQKDKRQYYKEEADKLKRRAERVRKETGDLVEAERLESLAKDSEKAADDIEDQLEDVAHKVSK